MCQQEFLATTTRNQQIALVFGTYLLDGIKYGQKYISIIIAHLVLKDGSQPFKTHSCVNMFCRQRSQTAIALAIELHKHRK